MADTFVDRLVVGVGYKTDHASVSTVMGEFRGAFSALTGYAAAIVAAAGAGVAFALAQASAMDETAKLAAQLRTTTEELTAMQYAASRSGVGPQRLTETMIRLDAMIAQAGKGAGPAADAFRAMGLSVYNADGTLRDAVGSLGDIADALLGMSDEAARGQALTALFGEQGARLRPLLEQGAVGIAALTDEAERLGLVLSSESAEAAERLMDSVEGLRGAARGLGWQVANVLIPPMTRTVEGLTDWLIAQDGVVRGGMDRFVRGLSWALEQMETPAGRATAGVIGLAGAIGLLQAGKDIPVLGGMLKTLGPVAGRAGLIGLAVAGVALAVEDFAVWLDGGDSALGRFLGALGENDHALNATHATMEDVKRAGEALTSMFSEVSDVVQNEFKAAFGVDLLEILGDVVGLARDLYTANVHVAIDTWTAAFRGLADVLELINENLDPKTAIGAFMFAATGGRSAGADPTSLLMRGGTGIGGAAGGAALAGVNSPFGAPLRLATQSALELRRFQDQTLIPGYLQAATAPAQTALSIVVDGVNVVAGASKAEILDATTAAVRAEMSRQLDAAESRR